MFSNIDPKVETGIIYPKLFENDNLDLDDVINYSVEQVELNRGSDYVNFIKSILPKENITNQIKIIVTIPVYYISDGEKIYQALSLYARQEKFDFNSLLIIISLNWKKDDIISDTLRTSTEKIINQAKNVFPHLNVYTYEHPEHNGILDVVRTMNDVIFFTLDRSIKEKNKTDKKDILVIRNDADMLGMDKYYLSAYTEATKGEEIIFTGMTWYNIERSKKMPGFAAVLTIDRVMNYYFTLDGGVFTAGGNFGYKLKYFAAINGYGYNCWMRYKKVGSDDIMVGYRLNLIYGNSFKTQKIPISKRIKSATIDTNDNRLLQFYVTDDDYVINDAYGNSERGYDSQTIRPTDTKKYIEDINSPKEYQKTVRQFCREMSDYFTFYNSNEKNMIEAIDWLFQEPSLNKYYILTKVKDKFFFNLTPQGIDKFHEVLINQFGDGKSAEDRNDLQRAVSSGLILKPLNP